MNSALFEKMQSTFRYLQQLRDKPNIARVKPLVWNALFTFAYIESRASFTVKYNYPRINPFTNLQTKDPYSPQIQLHVKNANWNKPYRLRFTGDKELPLQCKEWFVLRAKDVIRRFFLENTFFWEAKLLYGFNTCLLSFLSPEGWDCRLLTIWITIGFILYL